MTFSIRVIATSALLSLPISSNATAENTSPSFDCGMAEEEAEKQICRSKTLSALDRQISEAYKAALQRLASDPAAISELRANQRHFVELRDRTLGRAPDAAEDLMATHRNFLRGIALRDGEEFLGAWEMVAGAVIIRKRAQGEFGVDAETMRDPISGSGTCRWVGTFEKRGATLVSTEGDRAWTPELTLRGRLLVIQVAEPRTRDPLTTPGPEYCGANGSLAGTFLPVRGPKPSYGDTILADPSE